MPAFNAERHIGESIQSVLDQTLGDWELIVVDDESTDHYVQSSIRRPTAAIQSQVADLRCISVVREGRSLEGHGYVFFERIDETSRRYGSLSAAYFSD